MTSVTYYDTAGQLIDTFVDGVYGLGPMASATIMINGSDTRGGLGANFIVEWGAEAAVSDPVVETVMVGSSGTKGLSFTSPARVLQSSCQCRPAAGSYETLPAGATPSSCCRNGAQIGAGADWDVAKPFFAHMSSMLQGPAAPLRSPAEKTYCTRNSGRMFPMQDHEEKSIAALTAEIVSAYVSKNTVSTSEIGRLIAETARQLQTLDQPQEQNPDKPEPAVAVRRSIGQDHLICLVCGKKQRMLKRHLAVEHDLTPEGYRRTFGLKSDYPMVAPTYAEMRRALAVKIGLGRPGKRAGKTAAVAPTKDAPAKTRRRRTKVASEQAE